MFQFYAMFQFDVSIQWSKRTEERCDFWDPKQQISPERREMLLALSQEY
jgi:hypothetical protein